MNFKGRIDWGAPGGDPEPNAGEDANGPDADLAAIYRVALAIPPAERPLALLMLQAVAAWSSVKDVAANPPPRPADILPMRKRAPRQKRNG